MATRSAAKLNVTAEGTSNNQPIPERYAYCVPDSRGQSRKADNIRPAIFWSKGPEDTRSYAVIVVDTDVPSNFESANRPGKTIPASMPRRNFYHWVQIDIPPDVTELSEGRSGRVEPGVSGQNDFGSSGESQGIGYDGPCPPWNDELLHHYHFQVYALDVPSLGLKGKFTGEEAEKAMQGHILAKGEVIGTYTTNQKMRSAA